MGGASRFITLLTNPLSPVLRRPPSTTFRRLRISAAAANSHHHHHHHHHLHHLLPVSSNCSRKQFHAQAFSSSDYEKSSSPRLVIHPWPEWSRLLDALLSSQSNRTASPEDAFVVYEEKELSDEFKYHASLCLAFSRSRPELLSFLSRKDIEVVATNGTPFLFKSALDIARRLRSYLGLEAGKELGQSDATLVDVMKYILSYARNPSASSERTSLYSRELVESSVRNLLKQITEASFGDPVQKLPTPQDQQFNFIYEETSRPVRQTIEMKRGDWICTKCSFMNFARNLKCLECEEEPRPSNHLTGREWHCPQCSFYNYGRNLVCLRCDCKRPGTAFANSFYQASEWSSIDADLSKAAVNEDIREVTSPTARNTPSKMAEYGILGGDISESSGPSKADALPTKQNLDVRKSKSDSDEDNNEAEKSEKWFQRVAELHNVKDLPSAISDEDFPEIMPMRKGENRFVVSKKKDRSLTSPASNRNAAAGGMSSNFVPYVPFPPGYFAREDNPSVSVNKASPENLPKNTDESKNSDSNPSANKEALDMSEEAKTERWFKRVAQIKNISELKDIPDEDFPSIMPMRKGVNRFVVSKRKTPLERRLTSQQKRHLPTVISEQPRKDHDTD